VLKTKAIALFDVTSTEYLVNIFFGSREVGRVPTSTILIKFV